MANRLPRPRRPLGQHTVMTRIENERRIAAVEMCALTWWRILEERLIRHLSSREREVRRNPT